MRCLLRKLAVGIVFISVNFSSLTADSKEFLMFEEDFLKTFPQVDQSAGQRKTFFTPKKIKRFFKKHSEVIINTAVLLSSLVYVVYKISHKTRTNQNQFFAAITIFSATTDLFHQAHNNTQEDLDHID